MFKKCLLAFAFLVPLMSFAVCDQCKPREKVYVQLEEFYFDCDGIWFKNGANPVALGTEALHVDALGYYISKDEQTWSCPKCRFVNKGVYPGWGCKRCGFPYDD